MTMKNYQGIETNNTKFKIINPLPRYENKLGRYKIVINHTSLLLLCSTFLLYKTSISLLH